MFPSAPRRSVLVVAVAVVFLGISSIAAAQGAPGFHVGISGGADIPVENQSDVYNVGWNGTLLFVWNFGTPFGVRLDGSYGELTIKDAVKPFFSEGKAKVLDGTFDFAIGSHIGPWVQPYVLGGVGAYDMKFSGQSVNIDTVFSDRTTRFGWNAGTGIAFRVSDQSNVHLPFEGRYTSISTSGDPFTDSITTGGKRFTMVMANTGMVF